MGPIGAGGLVAHMFSGRGRNRNSYQADPKGRSHRGFSGNIPRFHRRHQYGSNNAKEEQKREGVPEYFYIGCYRPCVWSFYSIILRDKSIGSRRNISRLFRTISLYRRCQSFTGDLSSHRLEDGRSDDNRGALEYSF